MAAIHQMMLDVQRFYFNITTNQTNANLRTLALAAGWDGTTQVVATIDSGIYISSNATGTPALTIDGSFPNGVRLNNNGFIVGMGGNGGRCVGVTNGGAGSPGGLALSVSISVSILNTGTIAGGGGGGGAGGAAVQGDSATGGGGGGGRSSNALNSSGGGAGTGGTVNGTAGTAGTVNAAGTGGAQSQSGYAISGVGGDGGDWGTVGSNGTSAPSGTTRYSGGSGGSAGGAISGDSNITWLATGTRLGSIT